jgi:ACS family pantothenate transporter-like MFS transporter
MRLFKEKKEEKAEAVDVEVASIHEFSSITSEDEGPDYALTSIPFEKSIKLFFTKKDPPKQPKQKFFFWYPPNQSKEEKKLVFKLDVTIMTYVCLSYFVRYLDATNVASAYVTGMKEELELTGEQYVWLTQLFQAAYCFSGVFGALLLTRIKFSKLLPAMEILWGLLCLFIFKAQNFKTIGILRFFQGFCEGLAWPCIHYILGSWYTKQELGKRTAIFTSAGIAGILLSGLIQSALQKTMDGRNGLSGWRWLFIVDAIVTFPIAILGFLFVPDSPELTQPRFYLSAEDLKLANDRIKVQGKKRVDKMDRSVFKRVFTSYQWYLFVTMWVLWGMAANLQQNFGVTLKALGYDVYDRNNIPSATSGAGIVACIISGFMVDIIGRRIETALLLQGIGVVGGIICKVYDVPRAVLILGYILLGVSFVNSPIIVGWCNELCKEDNQLRAATIGSLNLFQGLLGIPFALALFNPDYAPEWKRGTDATLAILIVMFCYFFLILAFDRYQNRKRAYIKELYDAENTTGDRSESILEANTKA